MKLGVVILAAGQGTRMRSSLPKVLHKLAGRPLLSHVLSTARALKPEKIVVVYGHGGEQVPDAIAESSVVWAEQAQQLGTGHAILQALPSLQGLDQIVVLYGDVPLIRQETLSALIGKQKDTPLSLLTVSLQDPSGYGRIIRDHQGEIQAVKEHKDASDDERAIREINTGMMAVAHEQLTRWIEKLENNNSQHEYYLTDIIEMAVREGFSVSSIEPKDIAEVTGVNDRVQLSQLERSLQKRQAEELMQQGVTLNDPSRFDLRGTLTAGSDVEIDVNVLIEGEVVLGSRVRIGANTVIRDCQIADGVEIRENCVIECSEIGQGCVIGPFARIRPDCQLGQDVHIGNFVEIKKTSVDRGSKINHLSYIGDSSVGKEVNVGAGTITCNYDGANKYKTIIGDRAFIGSDTQLVAPVVIGEGATIGAGSTITKDAPKDTLTLSRAKQKSKTGWVRPQKEKKGK